MLLEMVMALVVKVTYRETKVGIISGNEPNTLLRCFEHLELSLKVRIFLEFVLNIH